MIRFRLTLLSFLEFAVWGSYLASMGGYLASVGLGTKIGWFFATQGMVSIVMPALMGIVADRWVPAQRLLSLLHLLSAAAMGAMGAMGLMHGNDVTFMHLYPFFLLALVFFMPTIALHYSVSYYALRHSGLDTVKYFPSIRVWGTIGFIASMWIVDWAGLQHTPYQFVASAVWGILLAAYALTLPSCPTAPQDKTRTLSEALGLNAFSLLRQREMALFFIFSALVGINLHITNGYANPFLSSFAADATFANSFVVRHPNLFISLSQFSETVCILFIPWVMKRVSIKGVMLIAMLAWVLRFSLLAVGSPQMPGTLWLTLSMIVYGVAFDFFNISGSMYVDQQTPPEMRNSAQGLFVLATVGIGAGLGMLMAQTVVNHFTANIGGYTLGDWTSVWGVFAAYATVVAVVFALSFGNKHHKT